MSELAVLDRSRAADYLIGDIDFLIEQFSKLTDSKKFEKISEFTERVRHLPPELTPFPGKFSYDRFPYFRKIVDMMGPDDPTEEVVFLKGAQEGFSTGVLEPVILYRIMCRPAPQAFITASTGLLKASVQTKIERMIDMAGARHLIFSQSKKNVRSRESGDTGISKEYPGGYLHMFGGKAPDRFRGMAYPNVNCDEADAYPKNIKGEGSVFDLIRNRTNSFPGKRKVLVGSTPLEEQNSLTYQRFLMGDQQKYYVPCKHCGHMQELVWHGKREDGSEYGIVFKWDGEFNPIIESVGYECIHCRRIMKNYDKAAIMSLGEWRPTAKSKLPNMHSFHHSPLYNPPGMFSWEDAVLRWCECWDLEHNRVKDKEKYRVFRNTVQGLPFRNTGEQVRFEKAMLHRRFGFAKGMVPNKMAVKDTGSPILIIDATVDVQKHNLFVDVKGYCENGSTWTLDFFPIDGDTEDFGGPWNELGKYFEEKIFYGDDGKCYRIAIMLIDSGRYTDYVYAFCQRYSAGVWACKGSAYLAGGETYKLFNKSTLDRINLPLAYHINTTKLKDRIARSLNFLQWNEGEYQPSWYPNFPEDFRDDYFKMFEAENRVDIYDKATEKYIRTEWRQQHNAPNHAFDTYVYNLAALEIFADDICRNNLEIPGLDWTAFWRFAKAGNFYFSQEK